jgi:hypothetical protein
MIPAAAAVVAAQVSASLWVMLVKLHSTPTPITGSALPTKQQTK